jgi:multidrug efflux pump
MRLPELAIKRPVLAVVISLVLVIFGLLSYNQLAVREFPDTDPPIISINTTYRGASATIIEKQVTQIIEDAVAGISGVDRITSSSSEASSRVSIEFSLIRNIEDAANDVRDQVARAVRHLPEQADRPRISKHDSGARPIMWLGFNSARMSAIQLTDYAERFLVDRLSVIDGVARVRLGGARRLAMRIWLDKQALAARGLTVQDVEEAIEEQNISLPSGRIESAAREFSVRTDTGLTTEQEFRNVVIRNEDGYLLRLGEVARVEIGPENNRTELRANGRSTLGIAIIRQSQANTLAVANAIKDLLPAIRASLPEGVFLDVSFDQSVFIAQSIREVFIALGIAMALVVAVIFVFLRSLRATLIPAFAIPVSIIASLTVMAALGYSINVLTLLALVLAIGLVVDDAIVVLENIHRRMEDGEPPLLAAVTGSRQIGFAVIATTVVLVAVFLPISFQTSATGRLFREFGVAVATAVIFSSVVALTLTPMLCSKWLKPPAKTSGFMRKTDGVFSGMSRGYRWLLAGLVKVPVFVIAAAVAISGLAWWLFEGLPKEHAPKEDRGSIYASVTAPIGSSMDYTRRYVMEIEDYLEDLRAEGDLVRTITILSPSWTGTGRVNRAFLIGRLKPWAERDWTAKDFIERIAPHIRDVPGVRTYVYGPRSLGRQSSGPGLALILGGPTYEALDSWADTLIAAATDDPNLRNLRKDFKATRPELNVDIDRDRAAALGIPIGDIGKTLETLLGERRVGTIERAGKLYNIIVRARAEDRATPSDLDDIYVRSERTDRLIPLGNLVTISEGAGALQLNRTNRLRSITVAADLAPDYVMADALDDVEKLVAAALPPEVRIAYGGQARDYLEASEALYFTFGMALLIVFLALAAQFESFVHPLVIMTAVPLAVTGAFGSMHWAGLSLNVYSQIGVIMLIGLTAKNAILIVEFANQLRDRGQSVSEAILNAGEIRLRPILMTTISTALGALPLALATGAGAESRTTLGIVIIGGISFSTVLSLFVVPVLYGLLARFTKPTGHVERALSALQDEQTAEEAATTRP